MSDVFDHISKAVAAADVCLEPFSYFYIENVFPEDVYEGLLGTLPPVDKYRPINIERWSRPDGTSTRDTLVVDDESLKSMPSVWLQVYAALVGSFSSKMFATIFKKFEAGLRDRFTIGDDYHSWAMKAAQLCSADLQLMRDTEDYEILPHCDSPSKLVTMQFYLPSDDSTVELGTSIYDASGVEVTRFPFKRNSAYAFVVSDSSWHGRKKLLEFNGVRNTLIFSPRTKLSLLGS